MFGTIGRFIMFIIIAIITLFILPAYIRIAPQAQALMVERLGACPDTYDVGIHFLIPFVDRAVKKVSFKGQVEDFPPQPVITKDNVTMQIDTAIFLYITNPKLYAYGVERPLLAIENLIATILRSTIGDLELGETPTSRGATNAKIQEPLGIATGPWDIEVIRVELKNVIPPTATRETTERQMKAERECRESILRTEGEKKSMILMTGGNKESVALNAGVGKEAAILRVGAGREKKIKEAQGQVEAIRFVQKATTGGIHFIKETRADNAVLQSENLRAFQTTANGKANKIIILPDVQRIVGLVKSIAEVAVKDEAAE